MASSVIWNRPLGRYVNWLWEASNSESLACVCVCVWGGGGGSVHVKVEKGPEHCSLQYSTAYCCLRYIPLMVIAQT